MDEAFCRRLQVKFFVGRLDPAKRLSILLKVGELKLKQGTPYIKENQYEFLQKLTTLESDIISKMHMC